MNRVIHFEIPADEPEKVMEFYSTVFGWSFTRHPTEEYWLTSIGDEQQTGIEGAVYSSGEQFHGLMNVIQVEDIDSAMEKIIQQGGSEYAEKRAVAGLGWVAYFKDPEGTVLGLWQADEDAK